VVLSEEFVLFYKVAFETSNEKFNLKTIVRRFADMQRQSVVEWSGLWRWAILKSLLISGSVVFGLLVPWEQRSALYRGSHLCELKVVKAFYTDNVVMHFRFYSASVLLNIHL